MRSLFFIPARGGSKRLPGKNVMLMAGLPLIQYTIAFAKYCRADKIIVSTDDEEIANVAVKCGAEALMRPVELSSDTAKTAAAAQHCLFEMTSAGFSTDVFVTLQPTNPLRPQDLYTQALARFSHECDSVISVTVNKHKLGMVENGFFTATSYSPGMRSQDLSSLYYENGLIYLSNPSKVIEGELFGSKIKTIAVPELYSIADIDERIDFKLAELIYQNNIGLFEYLNDFL
ncbi:MAG: cytidylyltransferase domain-containing protein [Sediminibacterium sp.]